MHADVADEFLFALDKGNVSRNMETSGSRGRCSYRSKDDLFPRWRGYLLFHASKKKGGKRFFEKSPARNKDTNVIIRACVFSYFGISFGENFHLHRRFSTLISLNVFPRIGRDDDNLSSQKRRGNDEVEWEEGSVEGGK